jgi:transposase
MAAERLSMRKTKEILRLYYEAGLKKRQIARSCNLSPSTVVKYLQKAERAGIRWPLPEGIDESSLEAMLFAEAKNNRPAERRPLPDMSEIHKELRKKGVTRQLLWLEYKEQYPDGYAYSQFCERYQKWKQCLDVSLRQQYRAGEKMFVDFTGKTVPIINPLTGKAREAEIFVAVLGASSYTYAEALESQALPSWIGAHIHAFEYFGGVPEITIPDNLKAGVTKACKYEPDLNPTYLDMAQHYATVVIPARAGKPRDKAKVEAGVLIVTRWILAALRNHTFFSIKELNDRIRELLERLNSRKFRKLNSSRIELFETLDKPALKPLPANRYEYAQWKKATVHIDYHIEVDGHFYSTPYQLVKKQVEVRLTSKTVEIIYKGRRIATHRRSYEKGKFTTIAAHRPKAHQKYLQWTPARLIQWAESIGPDTAKLTEQILSRRPHPEQGYRSCLGIFNLGKKYTPQRLEAASGRALSIRGYTYKSVKSILESGMDRVPLIRQKEVIQEIDHENIRGQNYYG